MNIRMVKAADHVEIYECDSSKGDKAYKVRFFPEAEYDEHQWTCECYHWMNKLQHRSLESKCKHMIAVEKWAKEKFDIAKRLPPYEDAEIDRIFLEEKNRRLRSLERDAANID